MEMEILNKQTSSLKFEVSSERMTVQDLRHRLTDAELQNKNAQIAITDMMTQ